MGTYCHCSRIQVSLGQDHFLKKKFCNAVRFYKWLVLVPLVLFVSLTIATGISLASSEDKNSAENLTHSLVVLNEKYLKANPGKQAKILGKLINVASKRKKLLSKLIDEDTGEMLRVAVPSDLRASMPLEVQPYIEQEIEIEGELEVMYEDYDKESRLRYFVKTAHERFSLNFKAHPPRLRTGTQVRVTGMNIDGAIALASGDSSVSNLAMDPSIAGSTTATAISPEVPNTFGEQRTVVILVNFQDKQTEPWTLDLARNLVFGTTSDFFLENSYQQTWLSGDVYGWYTIPILTTQCNQYSIGDQAKSAATAAGVDLSQYDHLLYVFPKNSCTWSGLSTVGGSPSESWINNDFGTRIVAHELGHGFGLFHSQGLDCTPGIFGSDCRKMPYGDTLDIMGGREAHLNAYQKERLGWLNFGVSPPLAVVETGGTYDVAPIESGGTYPKALKVLKSTDPATGDKTWYYLEYRQSIGLDSWMIGDPYLIEENVLNGVVLHVGTENLGDSSLLLDMTPDSPSFYGDLFDPALAVGQSYSDPEAGVTITTAWTGGSNAVVNVSFAQPVCAHVDPTISILPAESQWVPAGTPVNYSVTVTNNDPADCSSTQFDISAGVPSGWLASFATPTLNLMPRATTSTTLTVTSPTSASDAFYDIVVTAKNSAAPIYTATTTATYVVSTPAQANHPPTAANDSAVTFQDKGIAITVLANDSDQDGDPLTVKSAIQGANGKVSINANGTVTYLPNAKFTGRDKFSYTVTDGMASATATVSVTVKRPKGKN